MTMRSDGIGNRITTRDPSDDITRKRFVWSCDTTDATGRHASASALYAIARHSPDVMQRHLAQTMPLAFYAMHAAEEEPDAQQKSKKKSEKGDVTKFVVLPASN